MVGADSNSRLETLLPKMNSTITRIIFTGLINKELLNKWYAIADIGIISSYYEQCSYTGIEMMMFGLPIIASDGYGIKNMFENGKNSIIAKIGRRENDKEFVLNLSNAIIELLHSEKLCIKLSMGAKETFENKYISHHMKEKYMDLISSL